MLRLETSNVLAFLNQEAAPPSSLDEALAPLRPRLEAAHQAVLNKTGAGNEFLGWRDLLRTPNDALLEDLVATAHTIRCNADVLLCIGIGGSYLGTQAVIQALSPYFPRDESAASAPSMPDLFGEPPSRSPEILFAGHHMSGAYLRDLLAYLDGKSVYVNVISKSGTTLEPALAFRIVYQWLKDRFDDADRRIIVTTDPVNGVLNQLQREHGYKKYVIPCDVGGRFSVLTPVGLLPIATAGIDIRSLFYGAVAACERFSTIQENPVLAYAALRYLLLQQGYSVDVMAVFEPCLRGVGAWWQQLFGESEGKEGKGLFPAPVQYSTDLHSLGQYMQDGQRTLIETFLMLEHDGSSLSIPGSAASHDGLDYLAGQSLSHINRKAYEGTIRAHTAGGVPTLTLWLDRLDPGALGECLYFFEHAVAVGGYLLGINPFDQPGVEAYKQEMFRLLGRP